MGNSHALLTDLYQITMAQGYWKLGKHLQIAAFDLFFRSLPFKNGYVLTCGLETIIQWILRYQFTTEDISYLASLQDESGAALFEADFLQALKEMRLTIDLDAIPEGTVVFPKEPLLRVTGPLWQCQLLESILLNLINFPTLIATKAARISQVLQGANLIEFGVRRAQGPDGGLTASRAAFVGGAESTSNVLAGKTFGIPVKGTHAHSWVMAFDSELAAFEAYASVMPNNVILLVDTYNSLEGIQHAVEVGKKLKAQGYPLLGIRLDSGNLGILSQKAREILDQAGFKDTKIVASGDLDEHAIETLNMFHAPISIFGVGTRLVTGHPDGALNGVYKLVGIQNDQKVWQYKAKKTDDLAKAMIPGIRQIMRCRIADKFVRDLLFNIDKEAPRERANETTEMLLKPIFRQGKLVYQLPSLKAIRNRAFEQIKCLPSGLSSLRPSVSYPVEFS